MFLASLILSAALAEPCPDSATLETELAVLTHERDLRTWERDSLERDQVPWPANRPIQHRAGYVIATAQILSQGYDDVERVLVDCSEMPCLVGFRVPTEEAAVPYLDDLHAELGLMTWPLTRTQTSDLFTVYALTPDGWLPSERERVRARTRGELLQARVMALWSTPFDGSDLAACPTGDPLARAVREARLEVAELESASK